jgi:hypothetical protein
MRTLLVLLALALPVQAYAQGNFTGPMDTDAWLKARETPVPFELSPHAKPPTRVLQAKLTPEEEKLLDDKARKEMERKRDLWYATCRIEAYEALASDVEDYTISCMRIHNWILEGDPENGAVAYESEGL